jgi:hypothetical protein
VSDGTVYVLHIEPAYQHARHYVGFTDAASADERVAEHLAGHGSPLVRAALAAGHAVELATSWPGSRTDERRVKRAGGHGHRVCPRCRPRHLAGRKARREAAMR